ncbi:hypothetical protein, partial [Serinicoccus chungangensis]
MSTQEAPVVLLAVFCCLLLGIVAVLTWLLARQGQASRGSTAAAVCQLHELYEELCGLLRTQESEHVSQLSSLHARLDMFNVRLGQIGLSLTNLSAMQPLVDRMDFRLAQIALLRRDMGSLREEVAGGFVGLV